MNRYIYKPINAPYNVRTVDGKIPYYIDLNAIGSFWDALNDTEEMTQEVCMELLYKYFKEVMQVSSPEKVAPFYSDNETFDNLQIDYWDRYSFTFGEKGDLEFDEEGKPVYTENSIIQFYFWSLDSQDWETLEAYIPYNNGTISVTTPTNLQYYWSPNDKDYNKWLEILHWIGEWEAPSLMAVQKVGE